MTETQTDRLYRGERSKDSIAVTVHVGPGDHQELPDPSGSGFDWGRPTPGARALAQALMLEADQGAPPEVIEAFFNEVVLELPFLEPWVLWRWDLVDFVSRHGVTATAS